MFSVRLGFGEATLSTLVVSLQKQYTALRRHISNNNSNSSAAVVGS